MFTKRSLLKKQFSQVSKSFAKSESTVAKAQEQAGKVAEKAQEQAKAMSSKAGAAVSGVTSTAGKYVGGLFGMATPSPCTTFPLTHRQDYRSPLSTGPKLPVTWLNKSTSRRK